MTDTGEEKTFLTVPEAADRAGVSTNTIYNWLEAGRLTRYKSQLNRTRIDRAELDALLKPRPVVPSEH